MRLNKDSFKKGKYLIVDYYLESEISLQDAAWAVAVGQSIGNPNVRNGWETKRLVDEHAALILGSKKELEKKKKGTVKIAFPIANINLKEDGVSQLLTQVMGGQLDIDSIKKCSVEDIEFPKNFKFFKPKFGVAGIREFTGVYDKPLLGGIIKPKVGLNSKQLLKIVKEMVEGGVNFIKEDEIMANPDCCPLEERVSLITEYLKDKKVIYAVCVNGDYPYVIDRVKRVYELGGNAVHINFWSGLGIYKAVRELDLPLFLFFQKSGDKILTNEQHDFHIKWRVVCKLAGLMGVDMIHAGMWGGYLSSEIVKLKEVMDELSKFGVLPSLSCGMQPGLVKAVNRRFGVDYLANVGGAIHGHPQGTKAGVIAMRQAIDGVNGEEYRQAIKKWGKRD
jgi:ribulose-bisphosphate carboxylase large chain